MSDNDGEKISEDEYESANDDEMFSKGFCFNPENDSSREEPVDSLDGLRSFLIQKKQRSHLCEDELVKITHDPDVNPTEDLVHEFSATEDNLKQKTSSKKKVATSNEKYFDSNSDALTCSTTNKYFSDLNLGRPILKAINDAGFTQPTKIQSLTIPVALAGRDICACSTTGTGKTAAFLIPTFERLLYRSGRKQVTRVLVLVPTRELAIQVFQMGRKLAKYSNLDICLSAGGLDLKVQEAALRLGPDVVVATPGRLIEHLHKAPNFTLADIEILILDEADRLLEDAFADQLKELITLCAKNRQTLLFSATMTDKVEDLVKISMNKPVRLFLNENTDTAANLQQEFVRIRKEREFEREAVVAALITRTFRSRVLVFLRTRIDCERMYSLLRRFSVKVGQLHGGLQQIERVEMLNAFKQQENIQVLCATDLAARGLDIQNVTTVINMNFPSDVKQYIHRVGRTARAGRAGRSISLIGEQDRKLFKQVMKMQQNSCSTMMQRTIAAEVITAYIERIRSSNINSSTSNSSKECINLDAKKGPTKVSRHLSSESDESDSYETKKPEKKQNTKKLNTKQREKVNEKNIEVEPSYTSELADIDPKAVKRFRHGPEDLVYKKAKREMAKRGIIKKESRPGKR